ncbi:hypothetical protein, variant 3 [Aphanomyces astaci]|uniref:Uncharacterized protein n=1 Tax=Aphanomyces astaci TaxID=112090 RepID=W4G776_APHAT|nr:hypothetical protein, variant 3 [Aphanomyces astaci]ETV75121.1 hypothetical protein, variant 3 [Aphanomyces astaci]|eukprot:XP_009835625.1 hypothetical protein, variant 3 [Aphanomyces astaci]
MHGPTNIDALLRHLAHRVDKAKQELAQLRQAKTDQGNNDDLEATDVTSTTTGDSNTPDDAKAHGSCGVIDMSSNNWFPEYSSNVESPHRSSIEAPREVNMTRKTRTTSTVDLSLSDPIHCNDERMRSLQLENQRLLQQNVELGVPSIVHTSVSTPYVSCFDLHRHNAADNPSGLGTVPCEPVRM